MPARLAAALVALVALAPLGASGQLLDAPAAGSPSPDSAQEVTLLFRVGAIVTAKRGACRDIRAMVAVPIECDEQRVRLVHEDFTPGVSATFRDLAGGNARQMLVAIPFLDAGAEGRAVLTYELTIRTTVAPTDAEAAGLKIPERVPRGLRGYVGPSPFIEAKHPRLKRLAREIDEAFAEANPDASDWERVGAYYDYVMDHLEYREGPDTSAIASLDAGAADCFGRSALFIALCRSAGVPARIVWVNEHAYPEFYLEQSEGEGRWFPAESAGTRDFGGMPIARPILQKGDDFRVPERPRDRLRYASDYLTGRPAPGGGKPSVKYLREIVTE